MKIGVNRTEGKLYLFWTDVYEEVIITAFAREHKLNLAVHQGKRCLPLRFPEQREVFKRFLSQVAETETLAKQAYEDACNRISGRITEPRMYNGKLN